MALKSASRDPAAGAASSATSSPTSSGRSSGHVDGAWKAEKTSVASLPA